MPSHRSQRIAEAIREVVSTAILFEVADPRIHSVTVLGADVSGDLRHATIFVSVMGTEADQNRAIQALNRAAGLLRSRRGRGCKHDSHRCSTSNTDRQCQFNRVQPPDRRGRRLGSAARNSSTRE